MFDSDQVAKWMRTQSKHLGKYLIRILPKSPSTITPKVGDTVEQFATMLARAREVEQSSFRAWKDCDACLRGVMEEQYMKSADQARKLEKDWPSIQIAAGDALPKSLVESSLNDILTILKQNLISIGQSVAVMVAGKKPAEIRAIIDKKIEDALRDCASEFGKIK